MRQMQPQMHRNGIDDNIGREPEAQHPDVIDPESFTVLRHGSAEGPALIFLDTLNNRFRTLHELFRRVVARPVHEGLENYEVQRDLLPQHSNSL